MGRDMTTRIAKYDKEDNFFHELKLFRNRNEWEKYEYNENGEKELVKDPYIYISPWVCRNYEMFDGMRDGDDRDGYGIFPWQPIALNSLVPELREDILRLMETEGYYSFYEINLASFKCYILTHPEVVNYDIEGEFNKGFENAPHKENPLKEVYKGIKNYIYLADDGFDYWADYSNYKVIFYFDC